MFWNRYSSFQEFEKVLYALWIGFLFNDFYSLETKQENFLLKILLYYILNILLHKNYKDTLSTKRISIQYFKYFHLNQGKSLTEYLISFQKSLTRITARMI